MEKAFKKHKGGVTHKNPLLKKVYPFITSLESLIKRLQRIHETLLAEGDLLKPRDHSDYKRLLQGSLANQNPGAPAVSQADCNGPSLTQQQVVDKAVERQVWSGGRVKNVMSYGFRKGTSSGGTRSVVAFHANTTTRILKGPAWELLLKRIGEPLMLHLLIHCAIFVALPNNCYLQVCGRPVNDVVYARARVASQALPPELPLRQVKAAQQDYRPSSPATQERHSSPSASDAAISCGEAESGLEVVGPSRVRQVRPSSWQRKKAAKLRAKQNVLLPGESSLLVQNPAWESSRDNTAAGASGQGMDTSAAPQPSRSIGGQSANGWKKPSSILLPRHGVFYSSTFSRRAGLPKSNPAPERQRKRGGINTRLPSRLPPPPRRVPSKRQHLLGIMRQMIARVRKCPFGILLRKHCPLPRDANPELPKSMPATANANPLTQQPYPMQSSIDQPSSLQPACLQPDQPCGSFLGDNDAGTVAPTAPRCGGLQATGGMPAVIHEEEGSSCRFDDLSQQEHSQSQGEAHGGAHQAAPLHQQTRQVFDPGQAADARPAKRARLGEVSQVRLTAASGMSEHEAHAPPAGRRTVPEEAQPDLLQAATPHTQIVAFIWSAIRRMVPQVLLGNAHNRRVLRKAVAKYVSLRRYEQMSLHQAMQGLRISGLPFLQPASVQGEKKKSLPANAAAANQRLASKWVLWLFGNIVLPLLRANFYITESEACRYQIFYFRKRVWKEMRDAATAGMQPHFRPIQSSEACSVLQARTLGVTRLRFLPKRTGKLHIRQEKSLAQMAAGAGMRPIANLGSGSVVNFPGARLRVGVRRRQRCHSVKLAFKSINSTLQNLNQALKYELQQQPELLGSSVFGYDDIYRVYHPFVQRWRRATLPDGSCPDPYIVTVDVSKAFEAVNIDLLMQIAQPLLQKSEYLIVKYAEVLPSSGAVRVAHRMAAVNSQAGFCGFPKLASSLAAAGSSHTFTDKVVYSTAEQASLKRLLAEHLQRNLVKFGPTWHYQSQGIPQGSSMSSMLCSLYLAALEAKHLVPLLPSPLQITSQSGPSSAGLSDLANQAGSSCSGCRAADSAGDTRQRASPQISAQNDGDVQQEPPPSLAMRLIDDFLFVTASCTAARALATRLRAGFDDFGISINPAKTRANFESLPGSPPLRSTYTTPDGSQFVKWCGLLVNCANLELQADYTRYAGQHLSGSLSLGTQKRPGRMLAAKLRTYLRPKCHPMLLDAGINSAATVRLNIYQMALLAAMKFHCAAVCLEQPPSRHWAATLAAIRGGITYLQQLVRDRVFAATSRWLALHAFVRVLGRKQSRYGRVLAALKEEMRDEQYAPLPAQLAPVVDARRSPAFDKIVY